MFRFLGFSVVWLPDRFLGFVGIRGKTNHEIMPWMVVGCSCIDFSAYGFLAAWFLGFLVLWFLTFLVSWFLGFKVFWFQSFLVSKFLGFKVSLIPYYHNSISRFLEDIDPESKMFKNLLDRSSGFFGSVYSNISKWSISKVLRFPIMFFFRFEYCLGFFKVSWCLEKWIIWIWGLRDTSENQEIIEMEDFRVIP